MDILHTVSHMPLLVTFHRCPESHLTCLLSCFQRTQTFVPKTTFCQVLSHTLHPLIDSMGNTLLQSHAHNCLLSGSPHIQQVCGRSAAEAVHPGRDGVTVFFT